VRVTVARFAVIGVERDELLTARGQTLRLYPSEDMAAWPAELRAKPAA
jgi:hypothetical protein